ncbi:nuclear transport factor 2 family protein [Elioraea rosea]|uniref:nuclear transport factor 2 family protein n=1 Tax=Elioraea rosea TaxID=2492390 RepID=UPI0013158053|nr:nuclear transport factor 2 family protein [Elioraea rosea]
MAAAALIFGGPAVALQPDGLARLLDESALRHIADRLDHAVDTKDWALARAQFADRLRLDMSSLGAGPAAEVAANDLIAGWRRAFQGAKTSLHLRTNHLARIDGDTAVLTSHGYAWNRLPAGMLGAEPALWEVWGTYEHRFTRGTAGWQIVGFTFTATHERGDRRVPATVLPE